MNLEKCSFKPNFQPSPQKSTCGDGKTTNIEQRLLFLRESHTTPLPKMPVNQPLLSDRYDNNPKNIKTTDQYTETVITSDDVDNLTVKLWQSRPNCQDSEFGCRAQIPQPLSVNQRTFFPQLNAPHGQGIDYNPLTSAGTSEQNVWGKGIGQLISYTQILLGGLQNLLSFDQGSGGGSGGDTAGGTSGSYSLYYNPLFWALAYGGSIVDQFIEQAVGVIGRPKLAATADISRYFDATRSPVLQQLAKGAYLLALNHIPISSPNAAKIYGPYFKDAANILKSENLQGLTTDKEIAAFLQLCLHEMGNPGSGQEALTKLVRLERAAGFIPSLTQVRSLKAHRLSRNTPVKKGTKKHPVKARA